VAASTAEKRQKEVSMIIAALMTIVGLSAAQSTPNVTGTWTVTVAAQGSHGAITAELRLKQDGTTVSGTLVAHGAEHSLQGEFVKNTLRLKSTESDRDRELSLTATLKDDGTLDGYLSGPMGDVRWTAARATERK
jgi:hypothetical protein